MSVVFQSARCRREGAWRSWWPLKHMNRVKWPRLVRNYTEDVTGEDLLLSRMQSASYLFNIVFAADGMHQTVKS